MIPLHADHTATAVAGSTSATVFTLFIVMPLLLFVVLALATMLHNGGRP